MSQAKFRIRAEARRDINAYADYLAAEAGIDVAQRFIDQGQMTFAAIAATPGLGPPVASLDSRLSRLRKWRIDGFPKLLVFYIPTEKNIHIVRVLHASQDWWSALESS